MKVAIFDFDGTVYKEETFKLLMKHLKDHPQGRAKYNRFFATILPSYIANKMNLYPEGKMKAFMMQQYLYALRNLTTAELQTYFADIAEKMKDGYNEDVIERMKEHVENGVYVMLVSGAYIPLLQAVSELFPIDEFIGTEIPILNDKFDTNQVVFHVQGTKKNEKIAEALRGKTIDWENSFAYGDSLSDLSVLELVGNPIAVVPDEQLQAIAEQRNWEII